MDWKLEPIQGIGAEVIVGFTVIAGLTISIVTWWKLWYRTYIYQVHPENADAVAGARQQVQHRRLSEQRGSSRSGTETPNGVVPNSTPLSNIAEVFHRAEPYDPATVSRSSTGWLTARPRRADRDYTCPVCLQDAKFAIETNCGHVFCGLCIVTYWHHGTWLGPVRCPVCRQQVTIILPCFTEAEVNSADGEEQDERQSIATEVNTYNRRFSGEPRPILDYVRDLPTLLRHLWSEFFSVGGLMYMFRLRIILCFCAAVMYLISPLDIIPEAAFGILGLFDDMFVVLLLAIYVSIIYRRFVVNRGFT